MWGRMWIPLWCWVARADDLGDERASLEHSLSERSRALADQPADVRAPALAAIRQATFEGYARLAQRSSDPQDAVRALYALADLEQASVEPVRELPCPAGATLEACLAEQVGRGPVFTTDALFTVFVAEADRTRIVSGTFDGSALRLEAGSLRDDPLLASTARRLEGVHPMEPWADVRFFQGGRLRPISRGWLLDLEPLPRGDLALCATEKGLVASPLAQPAVLLLDEEIYSQRLRTAHAKRTPCESGFVIGGDLGVTAGRKQSWTMGAGSPTVERDGGQSRTWSLGQVTLAESFLPGARPPYGGTCELRHPGGTLTISSSYGCTVYLAADLDADGLTDFLVHTGSESCEEDTLWLSGPEGWTAVAVSGGCC
jgi:hypothetical protein